MESNDIINSNSDEIKDILSAIEEATTNLELGMEALSSSANQDRYLNNNQVCEMLHISQRTLQDYRDKGRMLERYFKQQFAESFQYKDIGSWGELKGNLNEIDIVALKLEKNQAVVVGVKRQKKNFKPELLVSKMEYLKNNMLPKYNIEILCLGLEDM